MIDKIQISIVIPVYNLQDYIQVALDSILHNNNLYQIQIVIVNDGSNDNSPSIISKFQNLNKDKILIDVINIKNSGVSHARNIGLNSCIGEYVLFLDGDDLLIKNSLDFIIEDISICNDDLHLYNFSTVDENGLPIQIFHNKIEFNKNKLRSSFIFFKVFYENTLLVWTSSLIYNRDFLIKNNLKYDINIKNGEDTLLQFQSIKNAQFISINKFVISSYRIRKDSVSHSFNSNRLDIIYVYFKIIKEFKAMAVDPITSKAIIKYYKLIIDFFVFFNRKSGLNTTFRSFEEICYYLRDKYPDSYKQIINLNFHGLNLNYLVKNFYFITLPRFVSKFTFWKDF